MRKTIFCVSIFMTSFAFGGVKAKFSAGSKIDGFYKTILLKYYSENQIKFMQTKLDFGERIIIDSNDGLWRASDIDMQGTESDDDRRICPVHIVEDKSGKVSVDANGRIVRVEGGGEGSSYKEIKTELDCDEVAEIVKRALEKLWP